MPTTIRIDLSMKLFSQKLQALLSSDEPKTLRELIDSFSEKSFAILFLLLLAIPALPLPTGGVTHIFEIIALLLALELIAGRQRVWLPERWLEKTLPPSLQNSALPRFIKIIKWIEKYSRPRLAKLLTSRASSRVIGLIFFVFSAFAFLAPPFSGLDTLPSVGVILLSLALIFEDIVIFLAGLVAGGVGIVLVVTLGKVALQLL